PEQAAAAGYFLSPSWVLSKSMPALTSSMACLVRSMALARWPPLSALAVSRASLAVCRAFRASRIFGCLSAYETPAVMRAPRTKAATTGNDFFMGLLLLVRTDPRDRG